MNVNDWLDNVLGKGDLCIEGTEAGDWEPFWCDDCETWHKVAYAFDFSRAGDRAQITVYEIDQDGNWEIADYYDTEDGTEDWQWQAFHDHWLGSSDRYFRGWARYYDWQLKNDLRDPLENWIRTPTREDVVRARDENLKCLGETTC